MKRKNKFTERKIYKVLPIFIAFILAMGGAMVIVFCFPEEITVGVKKSDLLSFGGAFLSFFGAFFLGYFIYSQDKSRMLEEKRMKVKNLLATIERTSNDWSAIVSFLTVDSDCSENMNGQHSGFYHKIYYDTNWRNDYYEYEFLMGADINLRRTIETYFRTIDRVNTDLEANKLSTIEKTYDQYMDYHYSYCSDGYSFFDAIDMLSVVARENDAEKFCPIFQRRNTQTDILKFDKQLYQRIENYIVDRASKESVLETFQLQQDIVDWLCENVKDVHEYVYDSSDANKERYGRKRVISRVVSDCLLKLREASEKIAYKRDGICGSYFLRNN